MRKQLLNYDLKCKSFFINHSNQTPRRQEKNCVYRTYSHLKKKPTALAKYMIGSFNSDPIRYSLYGQEVLRLPMAEPFLVLQMQNYRCIPLQYCSLIL